MMKKSSRDHSMSSRTETFWCKNRQAEVRMSFCLDQFVDVNALNVKDSQCFKCPQGNRIRAEFSVN